MLRETLKSKPWFTMTEEWQNSFFKQLFVWKNMQSHPWQLFPIVVSNEGARELVLVFWATAKPKPTPPPPLSKILIELRTQNQYTHGKITKHQVRRPNKHHGHLISITYHNCHNSTSSLEKPQGHGQGFIYLISGTKTMYCRVGIAVIGGFATGERSRSPGCSLRMESESFCIWVHPT